MSDTFTPKSRLRRKAASHAATWLVRAAFVAAMAPLVGLLWTVVSNGAPHVSLNFLNTSMNNLTGVYDVAASKGRGPLLGGIYHAILGTVLITGLAAVISVPIGLLTAIHLVEYAGRSALGKAIRFFVDVMTGIPSIVAGLFAFALFSVIAGPGTRNGVVAAVALSVLMVPLVVRTSEEMLRLVPSDLREAAYALGAPQWKTILTVVIPTAMSGITSGVTIAISRIIGETAPLVVTAGVASGINYNVFSGWLTSLPVYIYNEVMRPLAPQAPGASYDRAWAAAFVLILIVMALNLAARLIGRLIAPRGAR